MKVIALDLETSGDDPQKHAVVQVGVVLADLSDGIKVVASKCWLVAPKMHYRKTDKPAREYSEVAKMIHGHSLENLIKDGIQPEQVVKEIDEFIASNGFSGRSNIAYNSVFDQSFIKALLMDAAQFVYSEKEKRRTPQIPLNPFWGTWYDVYEQSRRKLKLDDYKLETVAAHYGLEQPAVHDALADAMLALQVFYMNRGGSLSE